MLVLLGFVLGNGLREGRDLMGPPGQRLVMTRLNVPRLDAPMLSVPTTLSPDSQCAIAAALRSGNKIEAIKLYRAATGADLKSSKDAVEAMEA